MLSVSEDGFRLHTNARVVPTPDSPERSLRKEMLRQVSLCRLTRSLRGERVATLALETSRVSMPVRPEVFGKVIGGGW